MWLSIANKKAEQKIEKGSQDIQGIKVFVEYLKGETRTKTNSDGKTWSRQMTAAYGRISETEGNDGDCIDVFVGEELGSPKVFIVDQLTREGEFDEHKVVIGCESEKAAKELYLSNFPKNWKCGKITGMDLQDFKKWIKKGDKSVPVSEL